MWIGNMSKKSNKHKEDKKPNPYLVDKFAGIPAHLKIGFLKFWLYGAAFYLTVNALSHRFDLLDRLVVMYLLLVLGIEYISNPIISWMHTDQLDANWYLPHEVPRKSILSLLATAVYAAAIVFLTIVFLDFWVSLRLPTIGDLISESTADPFSFAIIFLLFDYLWINFRQRIKQSFGKKKE